MDHMSEHFRVMVPLRHCTLTTLPWTSFIVLQDLRPSTNSAGLVEYSLLTSFCALDHLITCEHTCMRSFVW